MFAANGHRRVNPFDALNGNRPLTASSISLVAGIVVGLLVVIAFLLMPTVVLEDMAVDSRVAALIPAASPPLGATARLIAGVFSGLVAGGITWLGLYLVLDGRRTPVRDRDDESSVPVLRRADAHPDAPARRPVFAASDLGTPFLEVKAEPFVDDETAFVPLRNPRDLPADLDTPLAEYFAPSTAVVAYDADNDQTPETEPFVEPEFIEPAFVEPEFVAPSVEPAVEEPFFAEPEEEVEPSVEPAYAPQTVTFLQPRDAPEQPPLLEPAPEVLTSVSAPRFESHERIETFGLATSAPTDDEPSAPLPQATIHDLLERLERGVARRGMQPERGREQTLEETLDALRALAKRVG